MERQLEMEGQAISNPQMFPFAGRHGSTSDTRLVDPAVTGASAAALDSSSSSSSSDSPSSAVHQMSTSVHELEPELRHLHWSAWEGEFAEEGVVQFSSGRPARSVRTEVVLPREGQEQPAQVREEPDENVSREGDGRERQSWEDTSKPER